jgi:CubicO group peptidase (beta-lactamase class C family)
MLVNLLLQKHSQSFSTNLMLCASKRKQQIINHMKRIIALLLIGMSITAIISCTTKPHKKIITVETPQWYQSADSAIQAWVADSSILGAEYMLITNGEIISHKVCGIQDKVNQSPLEKDRIFRIHSMTKPITASIILMLIEEGKLSLNDKFSDYLNAFENEKSKDITIVQALSHTSGFTQPAYPRGSIDLYNSLAEAVTDLAKEGPSYSPGTSYHYSDGNTASLGLLAETITGEPLEKLIKERILEPLEMDNTYFLTDGEIVDREKFINTYLYRDGAYQLLWDKNSKPETPFFRASGGIYCSLIDYAKFMEMWLNKGELKGKRILSESAVEKALAYDSLSPEYGWHIEIYHHDSIHNTPVFGHGGSSGTLAMVIPETNSIFLYFTQSRGTVSTEFMEKIVLWGLGYEKAKILTPAELSEKQTKQLLGNYQVGTESWAFEQKAERFYFTCPRLVPFELVPTNDTAFEHSYMDFSVHFSKRRPSEKPSELIFHISGQEIPAPRL